MLSISKNKGEWAELYLLYRLLGKGTLLLTDPGRQKEGINVPILSILRENKPGHLTRFTVNKDLIEISDDAGAKITVNQYEFLLNAEKVRGDLLSSGGPSFTLSEKSAAFMKRIGIESPKTKSIETNFDGLPIGGKNDILLMYEDPSTCKANTTGFSIKSSFAHPATLQNGTKLTNFRFQIDGLTTQEVDEINSLYQKRAKRNGQKTNDVFARCDKIKALGAVVTPVGLKATKRNGNTFEQNLMMLDTSLPTIMSDLVYVHFFDSKHPAFLSQIPDFLAHHRPIQNPTYDKIFYEHKLKDFLFACFSGMVPGTPWSGKSDLEGGYLIIDKNFDIFGCLSTESDGFRNYLINNTKLDHSDSSPRRSDYGKIFMGSDGKYYIDLNLQVRFIG